MPTNWQEIGLETGGKKTASSEIHTSTNMNAPAKKKTKKKKKSEPPPGIPLSSLEAALEEKIILASIEEKLQKEKEKVQLVHALEVRSRSELVDAQRELREAEEDTAESVAFLERKQEELRTSSVRTIADLARELENAEDSVRRAKLDKKSVLAESAREQSELREQIKERSDRMSDLCVAFSKMLQSVHEALRVASALPILNGGLPGARDKFKSAMEEHYAEMRRTMLQRDPTSHIA
eukprot:GHVU01133057.1.p1 GENE.GHVU01133057.1~~GHVU01133057.1.p1  ORF type:complete len:237 (+),score=47.83 GHVU01133057.1:1129-1839(+)